MARKIRVLKLFKTTQKDLYKEKKSGDTSFVLEAFDTFLDCKFKCAVYIILCVVISAFNEGDVIFLINQY